MELLRCGEAEAFVILILAGEAEASRSLETRTPVVLERVVLQLRPGGRSDAGAAAALPDSSSLQAQLRGFLQKIRACDSVLAPLHAQDLSFSLELHARPSPLRTAPLSYEMRDRWVECDPHAEIGTVQGPSRIVPLKSMPMPNAANLGLELLVHVGESRRVAA